MSVTKRNQAPDEAANLRRRQLAAIHVGATQLALDDSTYRDMLERVTGQRSSAKLSPEQRLAVLAELRRLGAGVSASTKRGKARPGEYPGKPKNFDRLPEMITKIEALLADMGLAWAYADRIAKRMFMVPFIAWVRKEEQLKAIIAALHVEQQKRALAESFEDLCTELHLTERDIALLTAKCPKNWRRNRRVMRLLVEHLQARRQMLRDQVEGEE